MKILKKRILPAILAVCITGFLVAGFQIPDPNSEKMHNILYFLGLEEAYSGPCGRRGCEGDVGECTSYVVFELGNTVVIRHCKGTMSEDSEEDDNHIGTPE